MYGDTISFFYAVTNFFWVRMATTIVVFFHRIPYGVPGKCLDQQYLANSAYVVSLNFNIVAAELIDC